MKKFYHKKSMVIIALLLAIIPFASRAQESNTVTNARTNTAPCYKYWSVGVFGGLTQFNGDLSRDLWVNLYSKSVGYTAGLVFTKQFSRVLGVRARIAYSQVQSSVDNKWVWDYENGNGTPQNITQSFSATIIESDLQLSVNWLNWIVGYKPERIFSSYLFAGAGIDQSYGVRRDANGVENGYLGKKDNLLNDGNTSGIKGSNLQFKVVAGLGFDFNLSKHFSVPIELAWRWQNSDLLDMTRGGAKGVVNDMYSSATVGLTYKFGYSCPKPKELPVIVPIAVVPEAPAIRFFVIAPKNIPVERKVREVFPLRNYVFFNKGSSEIPGRYILLEKDQVKDFREDHLDLFVPKNLSGRSDRQMIVYYNIINILGDRLVQNPSATVRLTGASMEGIEDGQAMAESIKRYLVNIFGIEAARIITEGRLKPRIPSEQPGGANELELLREGDRRASIWSTSPALLMEYQDGADAPPKPVEIMALQQTPLDGLIFFNVVGAKETFSSWSLEIKDNKGNLQKYGPYSTDMISIPGKTILGIQPEGNYKVTMIGQAKNGMIVKRDTTVNMALRTPTKNEESMRFSVIYEFNESKASGIYEKYLTNFIAPKIPAGGAVIIHGYTDIIGDEEYNQKLSLARANDVLGILQNSLKKAGRSDVRFEVYGFGENQKLSPFDNNFPEERFYNRTVIIDIINNK